MNQERASGAREQPRPPKGFRKQRRCEGEENSKSPRRSSSLLLLGFVWDGFVWEMEIREVFVTPCMKLCESGF